MGHTVSRWTGFVQFVAEHQRSKSKSFFGKILFFGFLPFLAFFGFFVRIALQEGVSNIHGTAVTARSILFSDVSSEPIQGGETSDAEKNAINFAKLELIFNTSCPSVLFVSSIRIKSSFKFFSLRFSEIILSTISISEFIISR